MKKIVFLVIFALFIVELHAEDNEIITQRPKPDFLKSPEIMSKDHTFIIGVGGSMNEFDINGATSHTARTPNFNLSYLRRLNNTRFSSSMISFGLDFSLFVRNKTSLNGEVDYNPKPNCSNGDCHYDYDHTSTNIHINYGLYTLMGLFNFEIIKVNWFDLSAQAGAGVAYQTLRLDMNTIDTNYGNYSYMAAENGILPAGKVGLSSSFYLNQTLAIGLGLSYFYISDSKVKAETLKNNNTITVNMILKYMI
ncbi:MAG: hypothetical protein LBQ34_01800 [Alphaproteobacteria bacterium]|jgi:hypothetical protein|nr:hypothetical protein [Alphaproteobacteria bacterium]